MKRIVRNLFAMWLAAFAVGACVYLQDATWRDAATEQNDAGAYYPACGDLPALVGDDC